jgi:hypothetical protein
MNFVLSRINVPNLFLPILVFLIHTSLAINHVIGNDEGVALYTGKVVLDGGAPYLDSWDHKGPILYFLNAFGLWLSPDAIWGPGVFEGLLIAITVAVLVNQLRNYWSPLVVYSATLSFLGSFYLLMESLNLTESWTLGLQVIGYLMIFEESNRSQITGSTKLNNGRLYLFLGFLFSVIFYIRPNNATGIFLATITLSLFVHRSTLLQVWVVFSLTFIVFSASIFTYLRITQSANEFYEQFVLYNLNYSGAGSISQRLNSLEHSLFRLAQTPIILILVLTLIYLCVNKTTILAAKYKIKINFAVVIGFLGDFISSFLSSRGYLHYMIPILPSLLFILIIFQSCIKETDVNYRRAVSITLAICIIFGGLFGVQKISTRFKDDPGNLRGITKFLASNSKETDRIQILGSETRVLAIARRQSASSLTYSHPATSVFYQLNIESSRKLEADIKTQRPKFILRSKMGACQLDFASCGVGNPNYSESRLESLYSWIMINYQQQGVIGIYEIWQIKPDFKYD